MYASASRVAQDGVETGGSNVQFAINPENGEMIIIEMNPGITLPALASRPPASLPLRLLPSWRLVTP